MLAFIRNLFKSTSKNHGFAAQLKRDIESGVEVWIEKETELCVNYTFNISWFFSIAGLFEGKIYEEWRTYWKEGKVDKKEIIAVFKFKSKAEILQWLLDNKLRIERR